VCLGYGLFACFSNDLPAIDTSGETPNYGLNSGGSSSEDSGSGMASCMGEEVDGGCNSLAPCGGKNYAQQLAQAIPTETGGAITPGLYVLTSYTLYTGSGGGTAKEDSWQMEAFTVGTASTDGGSPDDAGVQDSYVWDDALETNSSSASTRSGYILTQGNILTFEGLCAPASFTMGSTYTATPTQITVDLGMSPPYGESVLTYTLQ
jgi:hypothetical protein